MPIKSVKMKISKNKKMRFFLMSQGSLNPKIRLLSQKVCPVSCLHTDTHTDRQNDYCGHPFRVSGFFLQPIIKDRPNDLIFVSIPILEFLHSPIKYSSIVSEKYTHSCQRPGFHCRYQGESTMQD